MHVKLNKLALNQQYNNDFRCHYADDQLQIDGHSAAAHSLRLPGKRVFLTPLIKAKKVRNYGNKQGALGAWKEL